ncbi:MAG: hypothetical protein HYW03_15180 [Deltaproteobacteria bacterium]|nr:hypothetical protein [Deltaproteobacteria bacterium]
MSEPFVSFVIFVVKKIKLIVSGYTKSFQSTIDQIAGKAVLQVSNGESGIAEPLFPLIRDTPGVRDAAAAVEAFLPVSGAAGERLIEGATIEDRDLLARTPELDGRPIGRHHQTRRGAMQHDVLRIVFAPA